MSLLYKTESYAIIGAAQEVHKILGHGFLESVYQEALSLEFTERDIPFEKEKELSITYKGQKLNKKYLADFVCYGNIIVELKAVSQLTTEHESQVLNYLKATGYNLALLINFGEPSLTFERLVL
jgi:GxxExxY protein